MSRTAKDIIEWLKTLPEDEGVHVMYGMLRTQSASLRVGEYEQLVACLKCHKSNPVDEYILSETTGSRVCPECGYEGGKLSPRDSAEHQEEWDSLFPEDEEDDE